MSRFEGPQGIVTNGLVLNLDAGDPDSYTRQFPFYCDALIVAGGGSGGVDNGGGGGGGGVLDKRNLQLSVSTAYTITVGAGGAARPGSSDDGPGNNGSNTTALGYTAIGGGGGSGWTNTALPPGQSSYVGGSGAGQSTSTGTPNSLGVGIALQPTSSDAGMGYNGGAAYPAYAGGGGGAGGPGGNAGNGFAGNGGNGYFLNGAYGPGLGVSDIVGAGGAGGWDVVNGYSSNPVPTAQNGTIKKTTQTAEDPATSNSGAGGNGGNHNNNSSGAGGSGVVVICYPGLPAATGGDILYQNGKTYHRFFSSGTFTPYKWNSTSNNSQFNVNNGTQFIPYLSGGTFDLDGTDDYLSTGSLNLQQNWTLEIWANMDDASSFGLFGQGITAANQGLHILYQSGPRGMIYGMYGNDNDYENNYRAATGAWYQWIFTYNSSNYDKNFYANSLLQTPGSSVETIYSGTGQFNIGATYSSALSPANGKIAITRFYNRILTQAEITQNFNAQYNRFGIGLPTNGLVLNLDANNLSSYPGTGNTWYDLSGNSYNGTLTNGTSFLNTTYGGCFNFDGVDDYVDLQYAIIGGTGDFTVNQWIQSNVSETGGTTFGNFPAGVLQVFYGNTYMGFWLNNDSTYVAAPVPFSSNPVMITAIRSGTTTYFYQNGVLLKTGASSANIGAANFRIGTNTGTAEQFTGRVFTTQVYNRALLSGEIGTIYATQKSRFGL